MAIAADAYATDAMAIAAVALAADAMWPAVALSTAVCRPATEILSRAVAGIEGT